MGLAGALLCPVAFTFEETTKFSRFIKGEKLIDQLNDYQLLDNIYPRLVLCAKSVSKTCEEIIS